MSKRMDNHMRENRVRQIWRAGGAALCGWLHIPSAWSAEIMANQGWDAVVVDMQHGMMGMETAIVMLQAIATTGAVPMARVNWNTPGDTMKLLDAGAYGIICPMIETREQCEAFVGACRFPPRGYRSLGPTRARLWAGDDYAEEADDTVLAIAMIETQTGFDNRDEICGVDGLDAVFVGIGDLRLTMTGAAGFDAEDKTVAGALDAILDSARRHGIAAGVFAAGPQHGADLIRRGYQLAAVMTDTALLSSAGAALVTETRAGMG